jgi:hypothetical protein
VWTALLGLWGFLSDWLSQGHGRRRLERLSADDGESGTGWERKMGLRWRLICEGRLVWFVLVESKGGGCSVMVLFSKGAAAWRR